MSEQAATPSASPKNRRRLATLLIIAAGAIALPASSALAWGHWHRRPAENAAEMREHLSSGLDMVLGVADASDAQEKAAEALLDQAAPRVFAHSLRGRALRDRAVAILGAPTIDKEALEAVRQDALGLAADASKSMLDFVVELGNILTPEQRQHLIELHERWGR